MDECVKQFRPLTHDSWNGKKHERKFWVWSPGVTPLQRFISKRKSLNQSHTHTYTWDHRYVSVVNIHGGNILNLYSMLIYPTAFLLSNVNNYCSIRSMYSILDITRGTIINPFLPLEKSNNFLWTSLLYVFYQSDPSTRTVQPCTPRVQQSTSRVRVECPWSRIYPHQDSSMISSTIQNLILGRM